MKEYLTVTEAVERVPFSLSRRAFYDLVNTANGPRAIKIGGKLQIAVADLDAWVKSKQGGAE